MSNVQRERGKESGRHFLCIYLSHTLCGFFVCVSFSLLSVGVCGFQLEFFCHTFGGKGDLISPAFRFFFKDPNFNQRSGQGKNKDVKIKKIKKQEKYPYPSYIHRLSVEWLPTEGMSSGCLSTCLHKHPL